MNSPAALPFALYRANLALQARIGDLVQAGGRHWLEFGQRLLDDGLIENQAELKEILRAQDWQKLAALPADTFWRQMQQRFGDQQAAAQIAVATQSEFARALQDAFVSWQRDVIDAMDQAGLGQAVPAFDPGWTTLFTGHPPAARTHRAAASADAGQDAGKTAGKTAKKATR
ncbi:phasin family protein [Pseudoxanthomonas sp. NC8]|nr:phasin family protein [Pseudoxanthomonas sp. NC8]